MPLLAAFIFISVLLYCSAARRKSAGNSRGFRASTVGRLRDLCLKTLEATMAKKKRTTVRGVKKAKKAKVKRATRKKKAARRTAARGDRCQPLRDQLDRIDEDIFTDRELLSDPDIPRDIKAR